MSICYHSVDKCEEACGVVSYKVNETVFGNRKKFQFFKVWHEIVTFK